MVQLAVEEAPGFTVSRIELDRPSPHYAVIYQYAAHGAFVRLAIKRIRDQGLG